MTGLPLPECRRTDAVLALHLDGDIGAAGAADDSGFDFVCVESLHAHLVECASCQQQLQRARRLDAALAASAGRAVADDERMRSLEERWMRTVEPIAETAANAAPPRRSWARIVAVAGTVLAAVVALALLLSRPTAAARAPSEAPRVVTIDPPAGNPPTTATTEAVDAPDAVEPDELSIAADAVRHRAERDRHAPRPIALSRASMLRSLREQCEDPRAAPADRIAAAGDLALATRWSGANGDSACDELVDMLTTLDDRSPAQHVVLAAVWNIVRSEPRFVGNVQRHLARLDARQAAAPDLGDLAVVTVAARLGVRAVDALVGRIVRRHPPVGEALAAALRSGLRPRGTATLLLDAWQELAIRGALGADEFVAQSWFAGQPPATFGELEDELRTCGSSPRRVRCLLALGFSPDERVLPTLLDRVRRGPELEAAAAAFALARLPRTALAPLVDRAAKDETAFFLRAALARAALDGTRGWPKALLLDDDETEALCFGPFRAFAAVAQRFRDRALLASN